MVREEGSDPAAVIRDDWGKQVMWDEGHSQRPKQNVQGFCGSWKCEVQKLFIFHRFPDTLFPHISISKVRLHGRVAG